MHTTGFRNYGSSTFEQFSSFLSVLNERKNEAKPLITKCDNAERIIHSLEKQLPRPEPLKIFRRLGKHTQLCLHFS